MRRDEYNNVSLEEIHNFDCVLNLEKVGLIRVSFLENMAKMVKTVRIFLGIELLNIWPKFGYTGPNIGYLFGNTGPNILSERERRETSGDGEERELRLSKMRIFSLRTIHIHIHIHIYIYMLFLGFRVEQRNLWNWTKTSAINAQKKVNM